MLLHVRKCGYRQPCLHEDQLRYTRTSLGLVNLMLGLGKIEVIMLLVSRMSDN